MTQKSIYQIRKEEREKDTAVKLYKQGFSTRKVETLLKAMGITRSHMWVARVVKERLPELSPSEE